MKNIQVDQETADGLQAKAHAFGMSLQEYLRAVATNGVQSAPPVSSVPFEQWSTLLRQWVSTFPASSHFVDDDRESLYTGRGE